jgi:hypothetical protein
MMVSSGWSAPGGLRNLSGHARKFVGGQVHKWQKVHLILHPSGWSDLTRSVFFGARKACAALAAAVTFASGLAGIAVFLLTLHGHM